MTRISGFESAGFGTKQTQDYVFMSRLECLQKLRASRPMILPSLLLCDFANLEHEIRQVESAGFSSLHLDVMDGVFVPNITYGMTIIRACKSCTDLPLDVHLMIVQPEKYIEEFRQAGADVITIHSEATDDLSGTLKRIRELDAVSGIAINPGTPVSDIQSNLEFADLVLPMSVEPGFGGQSFNETVLPKFKQLRKLGGEDLLLEIDGGINVDTIATAHEAGVDMFVAGSAIFKKEDYQVARLDLRSKLGGVNEHI